MIRRIEDSTLKHQPSPGRQAAEASATSQVNRALLEARRSQPAWAQEPLGRRLAIIGRVRHLLAERADEVVRAVHLPGRPAAQTLSAEVLPVCDACRFIEKNAAKLLAAKSVGLRGRPAFLFGVRSKIAREPLGVVLVIGPANYPFMLPAIQAIQALAAGNAVLLKPGARGRDAAVVLADLLRDAGLPDGLLHVLDEPPTFAQEAIAEGVDKVILTGSESTGQAVIRECAETLTPVVCELSGMDPLIVLPGADVDLACRCARFGATFNAGHTCIAPRRLIVHRGVADEVSRRLSDLLSDLAAPMTLTVYCDEHAAVTLANACSFALGASVFGEPEHARRIAQRVRAGVVTINDIIVPTADPRLPFGGRGRSGFGLTRGAEGLLEMTAVKVIAERRGSFRPHLDAAGEHDERMFHHALRASHGRGASRLREAVNFIRLAMRRSRS